MKLTASKRKRMPKSEFAGPGHSFPVNDKTHARLAISGATRSFHAGHISASTEEHIKAKARAKLGGKVKGVKTEMRGESLHERGHYESQLKDGAKGELSHEQFEGLDHGVQDHMPGRSVKHFEKLKKSV